MGFFLFSKDETYVREISRELDAPVSSIKREMDNLISFGFIEKKGRRIFLNKKLNIIKELKNIFIKTDFIAYPIEEVLRKNKKIKYALIFGSFARGDYSFESDIDLMVIGEIKLDSVIKIIKPVEEKIRRDINPVVWKIEDFVEKKKEGFVRDLFSKKIIMLKGDENELRKIVQR